MKSQTKFRISWIALIVMAASASSVIAQGGRGSNVGGPGQGGPGQLGPGGPGGQRMGPPHGPMLLLNPQVIKELKESDDQVNAIRQLMRRNGRGGPGGQGGPGNDQDGPPPGGPGGQGGGPGGQGGFGGGPGGPGGPGMDPEQGKKMDEAIGKILSASQLKRYHQIDIQVDGPRAFMRPEVGEALNLSDNQRDQIEQIMQENRPPQGGQGGPGGPGGQGSGGDMGKFADDLLKKLLTVLNDNQRSKYREMTGAPFKLERPQGGPRGQGGPGGPPPGDGGFDGGQG